jgi:hypothetical protein
VADVQTGALVVLAGTFLIAAAAAGTTAAVRVLDHRRTLRLSRLAGTPLAVLDAARRAETLRPLLVIGDIAPAMGLLCASPFAAATAGWSRPGSPCTPRPSPGASGSWLRRRLRPGRCYAG